MLYKQILKSKDMNKKNLQTASKINWEAKPKALVLQFYIYFGDDQSTGQYVNIKVVFKRRLNHIISERGYNDKNYVIKNVKSFEVLKDESSDEYANWIHITDMSDDRWHHQSAFRVGTSGERNSMSLHAIREVEV